MSWHGRQSLQKTLELINKRCSARGRMDLTESDITDITDRTRWLLFWISRDFTLEVWLERVALSYAGSLIRGQESSNHDLRT